MFQTSAPPGLSFPTPWAIVMIFSSQNSRASKIRSVPKKFPKTWPKLLHHHGVHHGIPHIIAFVAISFAITFSTPHDLKRRHESFRESARGWLVLGKMTDTRTNKQFLRLPFFFRTLNLLEPKEIWWRQIKTRSPWHIFEEAELEQLLELNDCPWLKDVPSSPSRSIHSI